MADAVGTLTISVEVAAVVPGVTLEGDNAHDGTVRARDLTGMFDL